MAKSSMDSPGGTLKPVDRGLEVMAVASIVVVALSALSIRQSYIIEKTKSTAAAVLDKVNMNNIAVAERIGSVKALVQCREAVVACEGDRGGPFYVCQAAALKCSEQLRESMEMFNGVVGE